MVEPHELMVKLREATKSGWKQITPSEPAENICVPVKRTILLSMGIPAKVAQQHQYHVAYLWSRAARDAP
jgi:hypothetical protein